MPEITEDDIYRASSQFRLWSFTQESLASLRGTTNAAAADAVRAAIKNLRSQKDGKEGQRNGSNNRHDQDLSPKSVDCLTVDEEQKLLWYYCLQTMRFADFINLPVNVKVSFPFLLTVQPLHILTICTGYCCPVHEALLHLQFADDLSPQRDHAHCCLSSYQDGKLLYSSQRLCYEATKSHAGRGNRA